MIIRPASVADVPAMLQLDRESPTAAHWTSQQYQRIFEPDSGARFVLVAQAEQLADGVVGFLVAHQVDGEWELENIVVARGSRRTGLGKRLLEMLLNEVRALNGTQVFLEVREANAPARTFYEKMGFQQTGRRKSYYSNPQEDAVLYVWSASDRVSC